VVPGVHSGSCLLTIDVAERQVVGVDGVGRWVYAVFAAFTVLVALTELGDMVVAPR